MVLPWSDLFDSVLHVIVWSQNATYWSIWCINKKRRIADIPYLFGFGVRFFATIPLLVICSCISQPPCTVLTAGICLPWWLCKGAVSGLEIPIGHVRPQCIACEEVPNLYLDQPITQLATQPLEAMFHTTLTALLPTGQGIGLWSSLAICRVIYGLFPVPLDNLEEQQNPNCTPRRIARPWQ